MTCSYSVSKEVYSQIEKAAELVEEEDYNGALRILNRLNNPDKLTEYEQVNVLNYLGYVYYNMDDIANAMRAYEKQLLIPSLEPQTAKLTTYTLAQLNMMEERYGRALELLNKWFLLETIYSTTRAVMKFKYKPRVVDGIPVDVSGVKTRISFQIED